MAEIELIGLLTGLGKGGALQAGDTALLPITLNAATGNQVALTITSTVNKATSGDDTILVLNQIDTDSPGTSYLQRWKVGDVDKAFINNAGLFTAERYAINANGGATTPAIGRGTSGLYFAGVNGNMFVTQAGVYAGAFTTEGWQLKNLGILGFESGGPATAADVKLRRDAAGILAQHNTTNPQASRIYGDYASSSDYQRTGIVTSRTATTVPSGASFTLSNFIPAGALLIGITTRVDTTCTTATGYTVGDGSDVDLWGVVSAVAAGTASGSADFTAAGASGVLYTSAQDVVITSSGGNFDGTGVITVCAHYLITEAD